MKCLKQKNTSEQRNVLLEDKIGGNDMTGVTHRAGAVLGSMVAAEILISINTEFQPIIGPIILITGGSLGGYLPDFDTPNSHLGRKLIIIMWPLYVVQYIIKLFGYVPSPFQKSLNKLGRNIGHRGITHTPYFWMLLAIFYHYILLTTLNGILSLYLPQIEHYNKLRYYFTLFGFGCLIGVLTHLLLDLISGGLMLFYPISKKKIKIMSIRTGGIIDIFLGITFTVCFLYMAVRWLMVYIL